MAHQAQEGSHDVVRGDDADLQVAAVLGDVQVAVCRPGDVVDAGQRGGAGRHQRVVVGEFERVGVDVQLPHPVVALGGEPGGVVRVVDALAAVEVLRAGHLVAGGGR